MLHLLASGGTRFCDGLTRREALVVGALGVGGLTLPGLLRWDQTARADTRSGARKTGKARSVILLFLSGGPSQLDMWDLKPHAPEEVRGTFRPIHTDVPGIQISEHLPRTARPAGKYAIVRSVSHSSPNHPAAAYWMLVGSPMQRPAPQSVRMSREDRPHPGSILARFL